MCAFSFCDCLGRGSTRSGTPAQRRSKLVRFLWRCAGRTFARRLRLARARLPPSCSLFLSALSSGLATRLVSCCTLRLLAGACGMWLWNGCVSLNCLPVGLWTSPPGNPLITRFALWSSHPRARLAANPRAGHAVPRHVSGAGAVYPHPNRTGLRWNGTR